MDVEKLLKQQREQADKINRLLINFKKDGKGRKTEEYLNKKRNDLQTAWTILTRNNSLLDLMLERSNEYITSEFYKNISLKVMQLEKLIEECEQGIRPDAFMASLSVLPEQEDPTNIERPTEPSTFTQSSTKDTSSTVDGLIKNKVLKVCTFKKLMEQVWNLLQKEDQAPQMWNYYIDRINKQRSAIQEIYDQISLEDPDTQELSNDELDELDQEMTELISELYRQQANETVTSNTEDKLRLAPINIPVFNGEYQSWCTFHDIFRQLVHSNRKLSQVEKLQYLKTSVKGEAAKIIGHLDISNSNYTIAWELLINRYNNQRMLCGAHINRILHLPKINQPTIPELKFIHDTIRESLHSISSLGVETDSWSPLIVFLLLEKLDKETARYFEQSLTAPREIPELEGLLNFIQARFQSLEILQMQDQHLDNKRSSHSKTYHQRNITKCPICKEGHYIFNCKKFQNMSIQERNTQVREKNLCYNCLNHHKTITCKSTRKCLKCGLRHHTLLHRERAETSGTTAANIAKPLCCNQEVLLATALVQVRKMDRQWDMLRVLIDPGSQNSFITEEAAESLNLPRSKANIQVLGMGNTGAGTTNGKIKALIKPRFSSKFNLGCDLLVLRRLTADLPAEKTMVMNRNELKNYLLADPTYDTTGPIDILLGADVYPFIIKDGIFKPRRGIIIQNTELGWIISGKEYQEKNSTVVRSMVSTIKETEDLSKFWELEELSSRKPTEDHLVCEELYRTTTIRSNGRYTVSLPLKDTVDELGESRKCALARFLQVEKRFAKDYQFKKEYHDFMREYEVLGHMVPCKNDHSQSYYIPHHAVMKDDSSTTKLRVVFDASAKSSSGKSLNEIMHTGPRLQEDLTSILIRWRKHKIVVSADIEKMYRQIGIKESEQCLQKILWRYSPTDPIKEYMLTTVTYGTSSAPYLAVRTLLQLADDEGGNYPRAAKIAEHDFYVDDLMTGFDDVYEAKEVQQELIEMLQTGGFKLRKWKSNCKDLVNSLPVDFQEKNFLSMEEADTQKTLGIHWAPISDSFKFKTNLTKDKVHTKRTILSQLARIYDPLGWLAPITIRAKLLIQNLWVKENKWDDPVPEDVLEKWTHMLNTLPDVEDIMIPRWIHTESSCRKIELHGFSDASEQAYGAAVYGRVIDSNGESSVNLLTAKSKVAPLKMKKTLPRLELCGAVLAAKLLRQTREDLKIPGIQVFAWTDSMITLAWIQGDQGRWENFVANRVGEILEHTSPSDWSHVKSEENPADLITRGISPDQLKNMSLWWKGPKWLNEKELPIESIIVPQTMEGQKRKVISLISKTGNVEIDITRFSSLQKLIRVIAYVQRFIALCRKKKLPEFITTRELRDSHDLLIRLVQNPLKTEMTKSRLASLYPYWDEQGFLRVGGRLGHSELSYDQKHPLIIPHDSYLATLLIRDVHHKTLHGGLQLTLSSLRQKYWIVRGKSLVRKVIRECVTCFRAAASPCKQLMGNLPSSRVTMSQPFSHSGVDYAGPIQIRISKGRGNKSYKGYIALFVCMSTKAIHLEAVSDLTTEAFLAAFRRFQSRRGPCSHIYSDNGTNFVGASKILQKEIDELIRRPSLLQFMAQEGTTWHFTPPAAPHFGGLWEAGVKSTKYHIKRVIGENTLTFEELTTVLCQIEACLNSRPVYGPSDDSEIILTPGHFLIGRSLIMAPDEMDLNETRPASTRWKLLKKMKQDFWKVWSSEYLHRLQQRYKWQKDEPNLEPGNIVLLKDENTTPTHWPLAKIAEVHPGTDGRVRVATVKTGQGSSFKRPVSKLCPLPIEDNKRKVPGHSLVNMLITMMCIIGCVKASQPAYTLKYPSSGFYIETLGKAMLNRGRLRVDIPLNATKLIEHEQMANQIIISFENVCITEMRISGERLCLNQLQQLQQRKEELSLQLDVVRNGYKGRRKRGLLGKLLTSVFGVNDEIYEDINELNSNQQHIIQNAQHQSNIMLKTLASLNSTEARITAKLNEFTKGLNEGLSKLDIVDHAFTRVDAKARVLTTYQFAEEILRELDEIYGRLVRVMYHQASITEFVHPNDFKRIVTDVTKYLPPNLQIWTMRPLNVDLKATNGSLIIQGYFAIIEKCNYDILCITSIPQRVSGDLFSVQHITNSILAVDADNEIYFEMHHEDLNNGLMLAANQYLCSPDVILDMNKVPNCALNTIYERSGESSCTQQTFHVPTQLWKHLYMDNTWMFITNKPERISLRCGGQLEHILIKDSGIIQINQTCTLDTGSSFLKTRTLARIQAIAAYHKPFNTTGLTIHITPQSRTKIPMLRAHEDFGRLMKDEELWREEESSTVWRTIHPHVTTTLSSTLIVLVISVITVGIWTLRRRRRSRRPLTLVPLPRQNV